MKPFKLSTAQKKRAHPWRHAAQRTKKIGPGDRMTWHTYLECYRWQIKFTEGVQFHDYDNYFDDWLRASWDTLSARSHSLETLKEGLVPLELALLIFNRLRESVMDRNTLQRFLAMTYKSLVPIDNDPTRATFILDAMAELAVVREHVTIPSTAYDARHREFSEREAQIAFSLRRELCWVDDADYAHVLAHARQCFGTRDEPFDMFLALLFPEEVSWGNLAVDRILKDRTSEDTKTHGATAPVLALATGADITHILTLHTARALSLPNHKGDDTWDCLIDMVITHGEDATPVITGLLEDIQGSPYLDSSALLSICLMSHDPDLLEALMRDMLHSYLTSKDLQKLIVHLAQAPDVVMARLPEILDETPNHGDDTYIALKSLLEHIQSTHRAEQIEQAQTHDYIDAQEIPQALTQLPWQLTKRKPPKLPIFWSPLTYPELVIKKDPALRLPRALYDDVGRVLMKCTEPEMAPAIEALRELVDETALSGFCWHLFKDWISHGSPAKQMWVFDAFLILGASDLVRELPGIIDLWIGGKFHKRGRDAMDKLEPNTNPYLYEALEALMHGAYSDGASIARRKLESFAATHFDSEPSVNDMLDALAPRLGLSDSRKLEIDPALHIEVVLDHNLEPRLRGPERGEVTLDATMQLQWDRLQLRQAQLAHSTARRLEHALITQRRWKPGRWLEHILGHPLLSGVAQRLIWGRFNNRGALTQSWRIDESLDFVDVEDTRLDAEALLKTGHVRLVHPLHLDAHTRDAWLAILADYEVIQPFDQLHRAHYPDPIDHADWLALHGKSTTHERLHHMFMRHRWEASPVIYMTPVIPGYKIQLRLVTGKLTQKEFKFELQEGIHKDERKRVERFELKKCVNLKRLPWDKIDPVERSELFRAMSITFSDAPA